jgi:hypothetical protein
MIATHEKDTRLRWWVAALLILFTAFAARMSQFGNPFSDVDENFYLLVGDRMLHGALPYVDIWDRKPIGLFLIYAAIRLLGGAGFYQYQIVATLFAAGTGFIVARIAEPMAGIVAATFAGMLYVLLLGLVSGGWGGQAPVFYNLPVAGAALMVQQLVLRKETNPSQVRQAGCAAMLLLGLAIQIKYTVIFEGIFFGLVLLWRSWRTSGGIGRPIVDGLLWMAIALLPTALALGFYALRGEAGAFIYANFLSIGQRASEPGAELLYRLGKAGEISGIPLCVVTLSVWLKPWRRLEEGPAAFGFVMAWLGAALAGYFAFGTWFDHYALPVFVPMAAACAPAFALRRRHVGTIIALILLLAAGTADMLILRNNRSKHGDAAVAAAMVAAIRPHLTNCMFVWGGDAILYHLTGSCIPSRFAFPSHLFLKREAGAIGVDAIAEIRRILATHPSVIVDETPRDAEDVPAALAVVAAETTRSYRQVAAFPMKKSTIIVYERVYRR